MLRRTLLAAVAVTAVITLGANAALHPASTSKADATPSRPSPTTS
jgi:hypothetical protein